MTELKKFNVKFKDKRQLDRTIIEEDIEKAKNYMINKYPERVIISIEEIK